MISSLDAQESQFVRCLFNIFNTHFYRCSIIEANVLRGDLPVTFINEPHAPGLTDNNVTILSFDHSQQRLFYLNYLTRDFVQRFINLEILELNAVHLSTINPDAFEVCNIRELGLFANNNFAGIPDGVFRNCQQMTVLRMWQTNLRVVRRETFEGLVNLQTLNLNSNTNIVLEDPFDDLVNLRILNLFNCGLTLISNVWFEKLHRLENLNLERNNIRIIPPGAFTNLRNLITLNLIENGILRLEKAIGTLPSLQTMNMGWNNLNYIEPSFFSDFNNIYLFNGISNTCINVVVINDNEIPFENHPAFSRCFYNFIGPTTPTTTTTNIPDLTTPSPSDGSMREKFNLKILLMSMLVVQILSCLY